jgi:alpha-dystroglycan beta1,4-xylosyltransferase
MPAFENLRTMAVVLLGDEKCSNNWILQYMKTNGGTIDFVFLTYDSNLIDDENFYQWPLGVSVYVKLS